MHTRRLREPSRLMLFSLLLDAFLQTQRRGVWWQWRVHRVIEVGVETLNATWSGHLGKVAQDHVQKMCLDHAQDLCHCLGIGEIATLPLFFVKSPTLKLSLRPKLVVDKFGGPTFPLYCQPSHYGLTEVEGKEDTRCLEGCRRNSRVSLLLQVTRLWVLDGGIKNDWCLCASLFQ